MARGGPTDLLIGGLVLAAAAGAGLAALEARRTAAADAEKARLALERLKAEALAATKPVTPDKRIWTADNPAAEDLILSPAFEFCAAVMPRGGPEYPLPSRPLRAAVEDVLRRIVAWDFLFVWDHVDAITVSLPLRQPMTQDGPAIAQPVTDFLTEPLTDTRVWIFGQPKRRHVLNRFRRVRYDFWSGKTPGFDWVEVWQRPAIQYPSAA